jgi:hypothetical protein
MGNTQLGRLDNRELFYQDYCKIEDRVKKILNESFNDYLRNSDVFTSGAVGLISAGEKIPILPELSDTAMYGAGLYTGVESLRDKTIIAKSNRSCRNMCIGITAHYVKSLLERGSVFQATQVGVLGIIGTVFCEIQRRNANYE